jgi:predicted nucleic acid-binding protein
LSKRDRETAAKLVALKQEGFWPLHVPTIVLAEALTGSGARDANENRFLKNALMLPTIPEHTARRAAKLRSEAKRGSAVDALLVALAEFGDLVITSDLDDLNALANNAVEVAIAFSG